MPVRSERAAAVAPRAALRAVPAAAPSTLIAPRVHMKWARAIARGVRADYRYLAGSQEELELEQTAYLVVVEYAARFDASRVPPGGNADGLFRGWAAVEVRSRCRREAARLQSGGVFNTTNDKGLRATKVGGIPERCPSCASVALARRPEPSDDEGEEPEDVNAWLAAHGYR